MGRTGRLLHVDAIQFKTQCYHWARPAGIENRGATGVIPNPLQNVFINACGFGGGLGVLYRLQIVAADEVGIDNLCPG